MRIGLRLNLMYTTAISGGSATTLALSLLFPSATVDSSGGVTDVDGTGNSLTYTGASHKRQYNADGVLEYAPHNLVVNSNDLSNASWTNNAINVASSISDPDGGTSAFRLTATGANAYLIRDTGVNSTGVSEVYARRVSGSGTVSLYTVANVAETITLTSSWQKFTSTEASNSSLRFRLQIATSGDVIEVYCPQVRQTPSASGSILTGATAKYGPRVGTRNRKPVTNLLSYPEQFDNAVWTGIGLGTPSSGQSDPFGGTTAFKLIETAGGTVHRVYHTAVTLYAGKTYTFSYYAKADERTVTGPSITTAGNYTQTWFNLATGEAGTTLTGGSVYTKLGHNITAVEGTSYYRISFTFSVSTTSSTTIYIQLYNAASDSGNSYTGVASSGLYVASAQLNEGGIEDYVGATNLLSNDKDFTSGSWTTFAGNETTAANSAVAPDGTTTADTFGDDSGGGLAAVSLQHVTAASTFRGAGTYTFSVFAKAKQLSDIALRTLSFTGGINDISYFDLSGGAVASAGSSFLDSSISYWGNGWYRCSVTFSVVASDYVGGLYIYLDEGSQNINLTARDGTSDVYLWGAQLTKGSTLYPYVGMPQTGFTKQGYLAEAAATNLVTDSEDFTAATWTINNTDSLTVTANQIVAPDGTTTADEIKITDTTAETHLISDSITILSATDYAISCFLKADEVRYVGINLYISSENFATVVYDLYGGTVAATDVGTTSGTVTASGIIPVGNGWYRAWASLRVTGTAATIGLASFASASPTFDSSGLESYAGTANDAFHAWGMMVETGTYPSSYIRTSGGTETRAADSLRDLSANGWYNESAGTLVMDQCAVHTTNLFPQLYDFRSAVGAVSPRWDGYSSQTYNNITHRVQDASTSSNVGVAKSLLGRMKFAVGATTNDINGATGGTLGTADTSQGMPAGITVFGIAVKGDGTTAGYGGFIRSLQYYSERKLDADLATLSTITDDGTSWRDEYV